jgi:hypothetical protein|uniref:Uncharacterized protein n=1 Tax=Siphoviridae sp. ctLqe90 TaxID=2825456 RepID=A0A8S5Q241_9CAUD|nr:MAG TPA: hypothetical protein [Siphoviridae sp. ctLqe90]
MFICCDNCLFNSDKISFVRVNEKGVLIGLTSANYLLKYKNEDLAKKAFSKICVAITKNSSVVDISESKIQEVI